MTEGKTGPPASVEEGRSAASLARGESEEFICLVRGFLKEDGRDSRTSRDLQGEKN